MTTTNDLIPSHVKQSIYDSLTQQGINLTGVGITRVPPKHEPALYVMCMSQDDADRVPNEWQGYKVVTRVTGVISAL